MNLLINFHELEAMILEKTKQSVTFRYVDDKTIALGKEIKVLFSKKMVEVRLEVEKIEGTDLFLAYHAGLGLELMAKGMMVFLKDELGGIVEDKGGQTLLVHLDNVEKLKKPLASVDISCVSFNPQAVNVEFSLKK